MAILFGCHGNTKFKKKKIIFLNDNSSNDFNLVQMLLGIGQFKIGGLLLGLVAMATESSHRLIMGKWLNCTFSITSEVT